MDASAGEHHSRKWASDHRYHESVDDRLVDALRGLGLSYSKKVYGRAMVRGAICGGHCLSQPAIGAIRGALCTQLCVFHPAHLVSAHPHGSQQAMAMDTAIGAVRFGIHIHSALLSAHCCCFLGVGTALGWCAVCFP